MTFPAGSVDAIGSSRKGIIDATTRREFDHVDLISRLAIALLPVVLLSINDNWIFPKLKGVDRWIYSGFHLHLPQFLRSFGDTYYASRLPWTLSGWLLHSAFDDATALYVLHFAVFYLAVFSLYAAVRTIFANTLAAVAAALLLGSNSQFLIAVGWDYVDGAALACMLASFAALASAATRPRWRLAALVWGAATCAMVSLYILLVSLVPIQIATFLLLNRLRGKRPLSAVAAWYIAGGVAALLLFGLSNWLLGGPFLYLLNQVRVLTAVAHNRFNWDRPFLEWTSEAYWLLVLTIAFAFSCAYVALHCKHAWKRIGAGVAADPELLLFVCCLADIAASLVFIGLQADHFYVLQMPENADALFPFAYLTIGAALAVAIKPGAAPVRAFAFVAAAALIVLLPWMLSSLGYFFPNWDLFEKPASKIGWAVAGSLLFLLIVHRPFRLSGAALLILFVSFLGLAAPTRLLSYPPDPMHRSELLAVYDASRAISRYNADARARFWFDAADPQGQLLRAVVSSYLYAYSLINENFPKLATTDGRQSTLAPGDRIILLTSKGEDPIALANATVADQGLYFDQIAKLAVRRPGVGFEMVVADVTLDQSKYQPIGPRQPFATELPVRIGTPARPFAYGARLPLQIQDLQGPLWISIRAVISGGPIGIGILNLRGSDFLSRTMVAASGETTVTLGVPKAEQFGDLVIQSWANGQPAVVKIEDINVLEPRATADGLSSEMPAGSMSHASANAAEIKDAFGPPLNPRTSSHLQAAFPVQISTPPQPWGYGVQFPVQIQDLEGPLWIRLQAAVYGGPIGIGVLNRQGSDFLARIPLAASGPATVTLRVPKSQRLGDLVIQAWESGKPAEVTVDAITVLKPRSVAAEQP